MDHQMISLADQVFEELEREILTEVYAPGEYLTEAKLSEDMKVSRTPIREAIGRREEEHLLEITAKGTRVVGVSMQEILDIYDIRMKIEGMAARKAAENASEEDLNEMKEALDVQEYYTGKKDADGIKNMDSRFHQTLYRICGSTPLRYTLEPLHRRVMKYRKVSISTPNRAEASLAEHRAIYEAIAAKNGDLAEELMVEHIRRAQENIRQGKKVQ